MSPSAATERAEATLRAIALAYPETHEAFPWGERVVKVRNKVFIFMYASDEGLNVTLKLPTSNAAALMQPFAVPSGYNLARAGWVTCTFERDDEPPIDVLEDWIDESYRAVAPKALTRDLPAPSHTD